MCEETAHSSTGLSCSNWPAEMQCHPQKAVVEGNWTNTECFCPRVAKFCQSTCIYCGAHRTLCGRLSMLCQAMPVQWGEHICCWRFVAVKSLESNARCCLLTRLAAVSHSSFCAAVAQYTAPIILFIPMLSAQALIVCYRAGMSSLEQVTSLCLAVGCHQHQVYSIQLDQAPAAHLR